MAHRIMVITVDAVGGEPELSFNGQPYRMAGPDARHVEYSASQSVGVGGVVELNFTTHCMQGDERTVIDAMCRAITGALAGKVF